MAINAQLIDCIITSNYFNRAEGMTVCKLFKNYERNIDIFFEQCYYMYDLSRIVVISQFESKLLYIFK